MTDIFGVLNMGTKALLVHQKGLYVTGNNISNVDTPGYSRQRLNVSSDVAVNSAIGPMGTGVKANEIERVYQRYLGVQINNETQKLGQWEAYKDSMERVETVLNESAGYGLNQVLSDFWNAWQDLTNNPSGSVERTVLTSKSEILTETLSQRYEHLEQIQGDIGTAIEGSVAEINITTENLADLNQKIVQMEAEGHTANDYRDQRELALKELSELIDIDSFEDATGAVNVSVGTGLSIVEGTRAYKLSTEENAATGLLDVVWKDGPSAAATITGDIESGRLKGWLDARDVDIENLLDDLDAIAENLMTEVNGLHAVGYGLDGSTGNDFFTGDPTALDIRLNPAIAADTDLIAAAEGVDKPGDNANAIAIANLQEKKIGNLNSATFSEYYSSVISDTGIAVQQAGLHYDHQAEMVLQVENYRESISGVSIDEETVKLVKYQNAYQAAAKLITTADEMMQVLLNMV